jgi:transposase
MANQAKTMLQIRRLLQLLISGLSERQIANTLGMSRNTVATYLKRFKTSGYDFNQLLSLSDDTLGSVVYNHAIESRKDERYGRLSPKLGHYLSELKRTGVTRMLLWEEYRREDPDGYSYQQFCEHLNTYSQIRNAVMPQQHKPAEVLEIDFAGKKLSYIDKTSGEVIECPVFVAVLPYSGYTYVEALHNATLDQLVGALNRCLQYFGGAPASILTDNMRQMVIKSDRYEPTFTALAEQFSVFYNTTLSATRVEKPKDKARVEKSVDLAYKRIYAPLRDNVVYSLSELNYHIKLNLEKHNDCLMQKKDYSRRDRFVQDEQPLLTPLPLQAFEVKYAVKAKVQKNYHVLLGQDMHYYSVPYQYIGKQTTIVYDSAQVEVYLDHKRIAAHKRNYQKHCYTTTDTHMPTSHLKYKETLGWDKDYFLQKAKPIGEYFLQVVSGLLESRQFTQQAFLSCRGLLRLADKYGNERANNACRIGLYAGYLSYKTIENILSNNRDKQEEPSSQITIPVHENIRGPKEY